MTISVSKSIDQGVFLVTISLEEMTVEDEQKILKFGYPWIDISPQRVVDNGSWTDKISIRKLPRSVRFLDKQKAIDFFNEITEKIKKTISEFNKMEDDFSGEEKIKI